MHSVIEVYFKFKRHAALLHIHDHWRVILFVNSAEVVNAAMNASFDMLAIIVKEEIPLLL